MSRRRYKHKQKKNFINFLIFYTIICIFFIASYTFSRYVNIISGSTGIDIAKFKVNVNDISVTENKPFELKFSKSSTFLSKKIAPNSSGYFEIILDPTKTEVSLEYEFKFNLDDLDEDFKLLYFTINDSDTHYDIVDSNIIKNDLLLSSNEKGFTESEKINIKIYWAWEKQSDIYNPNITELDNKDIEVLAVVRQKIK